MSNYVLTWVWKKAPVQDPTCLLVLASLADQANDDGYCWPSVASTAKRCRISERQVQRWIGALVDQGLLQVEARPGTSNMYRILGGDMDDTPGTTPMSPHPRHGRHPTPDTHVTQTINNHKEPPVEPSVDERPRCPYCKLRYTFGKPHNCSAMNMLMR